MNRRWWKESVVYQIYPRSFFDGDGDGIGDLPGITAKLDYLKLLGVDVVWLSPVYKSPNDDNGYDISDYYSIMPEFGTMADWERLLAEMHARGIRLLMDQVLNHTSDEHPWFLQSRSSRDDPYRDYYIWRPPRDGREPNNWASHFGGSAWEFDPVTGEYYLHLFSRKQPDLNWENPRLRADLYAMLRWWLDKGVDGFRFDVINMISKTPGLPDAPVVSGERYQYGGFHFLHGPRLTEYLHEMKREVLSKYGGGNGSDGGISRGIFTVGETPNVTTAHAVEITDEEKGTLNMLFQFDHMYVDREPGRSKWFGTKVDLPELKRVMTRWQVDLAQAGWNSNYLGNHDHARAVSRFGDDDAYRVQSAKLLATLVHMLRGTPYVYQGDEIGMTNVAFDSIDDYRDIETLNMYREFVEEKGMDPEGVMAMIRPRSRDNARTPMQWDGGEQAGFTTGVPWIKVNPNYRTINVAQALADPDSVFYYHQKLIALRRQYPVIVYGGYDLLLPDHPQIYAFTRTLGGDQLLVVLNWSGVDAVFEPPSDLALAGFKLLIGNYHAVPSPLTGATTLRPWEACVYITVL